MLERVYRDYEGGSLPAGAVKGKGSCFESGTAVDDCADAD